MDRCLGAGGLGDCFIIILKLLEYDRPYTYTHLDVSANRLKLSSLLLDYFDIPHECKVVKPLRAWWDQNSCEYNKHFNVFAKGYIDIPRRSYHWQPCVDKGYHNPFADEVAQDGRVAVQVNAGNVERSYHNAPVVEHALEYFPRDNILWFGTDKSFEHEEGINYCGQLGFIEALEKISECSHFVGFPSILFYWALYHKLTCFLFTDHQGRSDLRVHEKWKQYIVYDK